MIASTVHFMGMNPHQSGGFAIESRVSPVMEYLHPPAPPAPTPSELPPPPNVITQPVETDTPTVPTIPASASVSIALPTPAPAATDIFSSFMNWLTEETIYPGFPNGAILAGGAVGAALLFGGKRGRR